jgi:hypothetical protein
VAILFAILGFVIGLTVASAAAVLALSGRAYMAYWAVADRHPAVQWIVRGSIILTILACGLAFAYLGYLLTK